MRKIGYVRVSSVDQNPKRQKNCTFRQNLNTN